MIHLISDYYMDSDAQNFILVKWDGEKTRTGSTGNTTPVFSVTKYYSSICDLLAGLETCLARDAVASSGNIVELVAKIDTLAAEVRRIANNFSPFSIQTNNH